VFLVFGILIAVTKTQHSLALIFLEQVKY